MDDSDTPTHQQPCSDTVIVVNIPQLTGENNLSHMQLQSPDFTECITSNQQSTSFSSMQQQISGTINIPSSQRNGQHCAKEKTILSQQNTATSRPVPHCSNFVNVVRTAFARRERSPAEELSMDVTQITSPADGYFSRENIQRAHRSGLLHVTPRNKSLSLPTNQTGHQVNGFSTPPLSLLQMKLDFYGDDDSSSLDASDVCYFSRDVAVQSPQTSTVLNSKHLQTATTNSRVSSSPGQCLVGAVPTQTDGSRIQVNVSASSNRSLVSPGGHIQENPTTHPRQICVVATGNHSQVREMVNRYQRPQYSYLHLIQMAITSTPEKQMTLKQIYRWIEDNFLYYSYTPKQGWKNSIRHNLSLYDIFVRKKPSDDSKKRTSYWTLSPDVPLKSAKAGRLQASSETSLSGSLSTSTGVPSQMTPTTASVQLSAAVKSITPVGAFSTSRHKKGPVPLLPKVSPMQTYALIPIQGAVMSPQPFLLPSWSVSSPNFVSTPPVSAGIQQLPSETGLSSTVHLPLTGLKRNLESSGEPCKKQVKIAPKQMDRCVAAHSVSKLDVSSTTPSTSTPYPNQTLSSSNALCKSLRLRSASASDLTPKTVVTRCHVTPRIMRQRRGSVSGSAATQSSMTFDDSACDVSCQKVDLSHSSSMPRPRMYRRKCSLKHSGMTYENQNDSIVSREMATACRRDHPVSDVDSPLCSVGDILSKTPNRKTSTPFKENVCSPSWISPIKELTPLSGTSSHFDSGCFFTPDSVARPTSSGRGDIVDLCSSPKLHQGTLSVGYDGSPKLGSLRSLGMPGLTPLKSSTDTVVICSPNSSWSASLNHSFTRLFDDCHLNSIIDEDMNMDFSFSTLL